MKKNKEQVTIEINNYISKTSKHLFKTNDNYYTLVPFKDKDEDAYASIFISEGVIKIITELVTPQELYNYYGGDYVNVFKRWRFLSNKKIKSIPYFKKMRQMIGEIKPLLKLGDNNDLIESMVIKYGDLYRD